MNAIIDQSNEVPTGTIPTFVGKRGVAAVLGCCVRSVDNFMQRGLPYYKAGHRQVRFDLEEVRDWYKRTYRCQRIGREDGQ